ncbi:MAG TPA: Rrf2 family transcriptional regulator [Chloroflexi bacterium]|nr:Rrf2 family transcriptional regulator [Chloroflexota bacterium]
MLEITRQADYALRATIEVGKLPFGERAPTAAIAARQKIPLPFLAKIVSQLVVRGVLQATRGASGGVSLARPPEEITMLEIVEAIDGPITLNRCTRDPSVCELSPTCPACEIFVEAQQALIERLEKTTLADLVARARELERSYA